jgi:hypothetical protein
VHIVPLLRGGGGYSDPDTGLNDTFAATWNGTSWSLQSTVNPDPNDFDSEQFSTVSCSSPKFCVAWAGYGANSAEALAEQWNGSAWQLQTVPSSNAAVNSVSCTSASVCEAVGLGSAYGWDIGLDSADDPGLGRLGWTARRVVHVAEVLRGGGGSRSCVHLHGQP